ncbi:MAG: ABC transporter permease [Myxococcota bacterium]
MRKDLGRRARDPWSLLWWLGVPLMVGALITLGTDIERTPTAELLLVDEDDSLISGLLATALSGGAGDGDAAQLIHVEMVDRTEGEARMQRGEASALLIVPKGFGEAVLRKQSTELELLTNPAQTILPAVVEETLSILVDATFYAQQLFGEEFATILDAADDGAAPEREQISAIALSVDDTVKRAAPLLLPPAISVDSIATDTSSPVRVALLFYPGILVMALLLTAQGLSGDFWHERDGGTLERLLVSPQTTAAYVVAKFGMAAAMVGAIAVPMLVLGFIYHGIALTRLPLALLMMILAGLVLFGLLSLIQLFAPTRKAASLISGVLVLPLMMVGGSFFPFESMPRWLATIGRVSPNGAMLEQLKRYLLGQHTTGSMTVTLLVMSASVSVLWVAVTMRQRGALRG